MTALDLLTVLCAVLALAAAATLAVLSGRALRAARALESATQLFAEQAVPAVEELRVAAQRATGEVDRIDDLLEVAGNIGDRVDAATEATYRALTSPVIKGVAFASGTRRAAGRLRGRGRPTATGRATTSRGAIGRATHRGRRSAPAALSPEDRTTR